MSASMHMRGSSARTLPRIAVLTTGGTIAGYSPDASKTANYRIGELDTVLLADAMSAISRFSDVAIEEVARVASNDITLSIWSKLVDRVNVLASGGEVDGIVITHGTDTLEETAYLLHLTVETTKPVVLTGAMRPASALSADGALNLLNAAAVACSENARAQGVMVCLSNKIHCARDVTKASTYSVDAFQSPDCGALGWVQDGRVEFSRNAIRPHTHAAEFRIDAGSGWPRVEIIPSYAGASSLLVDACVASGVRGIVVAGTGNGSIAAPMQAALAAAAAGGIAVVRASRTGSGHVMRNGMVDDDAMGFVAAGSLNPYKARVLLMLSLMRSTADPVMLQNVFDTY